jgi:hypothetical protein
MNQKARFDKLVSKLKGEIEEKVFEFWKQFSMDELERIERGDIDPALMDKVHRLDGDKILELSLSVMTSEERAEFDRVCKELEQESHNEQN